jgi:hypothetical protein
MDYVKPELVVLGSASLLLRYLNNHKVGPPPEVAGADPGRNPPRMTWTSNVDLNGAALMTV